MKHSAGGVIINRGRVALVQNRKKEIVTFPKGRLIIEGLRTENVLQGAYREIYEETGFSSDQLTLYGYLETYRRTHKGEVAGVKYISMFLFSTDREDFTPITTNENIGAEWTPLEQVTDRLTYDADKKFFLRHRDRYDI